MPLLKGDRFVADPWIVVGAEDPLPIDGDIVVPFARLLAQFDALSQRDGRLGVVFPNAERAEALRLFFHRLELVVLPFPAFTDGRAYSIARQIRVLGFPGELRASGNVLPDQLQFMLQVGFDTFEVSERFPESAWRDAAHRMSLTYQRETAAVSPADIWRARHAPAEPAREQPQAG